MPSRKPSLSGAYVSARPPRIITTRGRRVAFWAPTDFAAATSQGAMPQSRTRRRSITESPRVHGEQCDSRRTREEFAHKLQSLSGKLGRQQRHTGDVAARVSKADDQATTDRIRHGRHHDGNRPCRALDCTDRRRGRSDDEVHIELYEIRGHGWKSFLVFAGPPILDDQVAALDIAQLA